MKPVEIQIPPVSRRRPEEKGAGCGKRRKAGEKV